MTEHGSARRCDEARHEPQDRGFSGPRLPQQRQHLAFTHFEADVVEHGDGRPPVGAHVGFRNVPQLKQGRGCGGALLCAGLSIVNASSGIGHPGDRVRWSEAKTLGSSD